MTSKTKSHGHIAIFAFPFGSHPSALLNNAQRLASVAVQADTIFSFFNISSSNAKIFTARPRSTHNFKAYDVSDGVEVGVDSPKSPLDVIGLFLKASPANFMEGVQKAEKESGVKVSCILADAFLWFCGDMAKELDVPWIAFWIAGPSSLSVHMHTDLIRTNTLTQAGDKKGSEETLQFLPGLSSIHMTDLPDEVIGEIESPFSKMIYKMGSKVVEATAVILNSFEEIEPIVANHLKQILRNVLHIGPSTITIPPLLASDDETGCLTWLDTRQMSSVVYIGFGTVLVPPPNEIVALAEALDAKKIPFLWSLGDNAKVFIPKELLEKISGIGKIVPWTPQLQVLVHPTVGVYVTHCGYNSVMESVLASVPVIGRPLLGDNAINCRFVEEVWKIGVRVEGGIFTKNGMMNALDVIMGSDDKGKEIKKNVGVLRELLLETIGPNGSSSKNFKALSDLLITIN